MIYRDGFLKDLRQAAVAAEKDFVREGFALQREDEVALSAYLPVCLERHAAQLGRQHGVDVKVRHLHTYASGADDLDEPVAGADLLLLMDAKIEGYRVKKGVLVQAKLDGNELTSKKPVRGKPPIVSIGTPKKLTRAKSSAAKCANQVRTQATKMLKVSPAAFVAVYSRGGIRLVNAISVEGAGTKMDLTAIRFADFFTDFIDTPIGDKGLHRYAERSADMKDLLEALDSAVPLVVVEVQVRTDTAEQRVPRVMKPLDESPASGLIEASDIGQALDDAIGLFERPDKKLESRKLKPKQLPPQDAEGV